MRCPRCDSQNIQIVQGDSRVKGNGCLWSIVRLMLILCTCGLWLLVGKRNGKIKTSTRAVCMNCGHKWNI